MAVPETGPRWRVCDMAPTLVAATGVRHNRLPPVRQVFYEPELLATPFTAFGPNFDAPKTKSFTAVLDALGIADKKALLVVGQSSQNVYLSSRNLQRAEVVTDKELSTYKIINAQHLVLAESAVETIVSNLSK